MNHKNKIPKAKEGMRGVRDEVLVLDSSTKRGQSRVNISQEAQREKRETLKDPEVKEQLMDFLFGKSDENPLQSITDKSQDKLNDLKNKKYKTENMTGMPKEEE